MAVWYKFGIIWDWICKLASSCSISSGFTYFYKFNGYIYKELGWETLAERGERKILQHWQKEENGKYFKCFMILHKKLYQNI